jgi:hypothetical protein
MTDQTPEQSICTADKAMLRDAQCTDSEITAHLFLHSKGKCPLSDDPAIVTEYEQLVRAFS